MLRPLLASLICLSAATLYAGEAATAAKDTILRRDNQPPIQTIIESETVDGVLHRMNSTDRQARLVRGDEILRITYAGMDSGAWAKGCEARARGDFPAAAEQFSQLATTGQREWERVYGALAAGECLELAGKFDEAAASFDLVAQKYAGNATVKPPVPRHRRWLDSMYRKGAAFALGGKNDDAQKVAVILDEIGKKEALSAADVRAAAIRALIASQDGNPKLNEFIRKAAFRATSSEETDAWYHFKSALGGLLKTQKKFKEAVQVYRDIQAELPKLAPDRTRDISVSLNLAISLAGIPEQRGAALTELIRIDSLPYGSADQLCEARATAAQLLWDDAKKITSDADAMKNTSKAEWAKEQEDAARFMATAAAAGPANHPAVAQAKALLQTIGPAK